jgi:hypothetical protein
MPNGKRKFTTTTTTTSNAAADAECVFAIQHLSRVHLDSRSVTRLLFRRKVMHELRRALFIANAGNDQASSLKRQSKLAASV